MIASSQFTTHLLLLLYSFNNWLGCSALRLPFITNNKFQLLKVLFQTLISKQHNIMNPKVKVRATEQEEECVYPENSSGSWMFSKFIELLYIEEEKNQRECPPSISKSTRVCPQNFTMRSTPSTRGVLKSVNRLGESPKENARACSVIRPRAVLSSPENDGLIGSINELNNSTTSGKKEVARGKMESQAKVLCAQVKGGKYLEREDCEAFNKGKTPLSKSSR